MMLLWLVVGFVYTGCAHGCYKIGMEIVEEEGLNFSKPARIITIGALWPLLVVCGLFLKGVEK